MGRTSGASTLRGVHLLLAGSTLLSPCRGATDEDIRALHDRINRLEQRIVVLEVQAEETTRKNPRGSSPAIKTATASADGASPEWVDTGSRAFSLRGKQIFHGVGSASGITNQALAVATANNRAHAEIARLLETCTEIATKRIGAAPAKPRRKGHAPAEEALKTVSAASLSRVEIVDHWIHPTNGTIYALARLDLTSARGEIRAPKSMKPKAKKQIDRALEEAFEEMAGGE